jgi:hypothetical protein
MSAMALVAAAAVQAALEKMYRAGLERLEG